MQQVDKKLPQHSSGATKKPHITHANDEFVQSKNDLTAIIALFAYGKGMYHVLILALVLIMGSSLVLMLSAKALGSFVDCLLKPHATATVVGLSLTILGLEFVSVVLNYFGKVTLSTVTTKIALQIRLSLFQKITRLPISYFDRQPLGRTITRLTTDVEGIETFFSTTLARVLSAVITFFAILVAMFVTNLKVGLVVAASTLPAIILTFAVRGAIKEWNRLYKVCSSRINAKLAEYINGIMVIKVFGLENWSYDNFKKCSHEQLDAGIGLMSVNSLVRPTINLFCFLPIAVLLWWGGARVLEGSMALGLLVSFIRYTERVARPIISLSNEIHVMQDAITSSERVKQMLDEIEEIDVLGPSGTLADRIEGHVVYNDIWMEYEKSTPILKGVSFDVKKGMKVGLVGATGSGKTTTLNLIPQLYPKVSGQIVLDGKPLEQWDRETVRSQLGLVSQDIVIFKGTLRDNLIIGADRITALTDEKILKYCEKSGLKAIMHRFTAGLDSKILDGGDNLSAGERQLIAFTRMLIRNPSVLILDEATSNIDPECEELIQKAIKETLHDRTCFVIAHRLNTILQCDEILVFKDGRIVERGSHFELLAQCGHYSQLARKQMAASAVH
jgi:ABC-type multidrug transport system fused ATPase/permease subunit